MGFFDEGVCHWRIPGEVAFALSYPILWYRIYSVGVAGISTETQLLHFLTFFFRYLCYPDEMFGISVYNSLAKIWYSTCSALTLSYLLFHHRSSLSLRPSRAASVTFLVSAILVMFPIYLSTRSTNNAEFIPAEFLEENVDFFKFTLTSDLIREAPWNMSQFLAVGAMIPQLIILFKAAGSGFRTIALTDDNGPEAKRSVRLVVGVDVWMWKYVASVAAFRTFYIPHWIWRYQTQNFLDPMAQICALLQLIIIYGFILAILIRGSCSNRQSDSALLPESGLGGGKVAPAPINGFDVKRPVLPMIIVTDVA